MSGLTILLVFLGGAVGAGLRAGLSRAMRPHRAVLAVNLSGAFLAGVLLATMGDGDMPAPDHPLWAFAALGVLGGYTTVSSFALHAVTLGRGAGGYVLATALGCPLAAALGWGLA
jgi:CrcB protein